MPIGKLGNSKPKISTEYGGAPYYKTLPMRTGSS
ncbi:hypothetical protein BIW11_02832 [Tropilaelaps mercedesae]|uniref:Uncharacterized protein n=1 Tax=Tropilaelaps mercedesae TaxID=418985 RepID=A0A1V9XWQ9_9ACAR|nr:hypothetical protein BIW11_02832 [Tropilaelaps mercedesae]